MGQMLKQAEEYWLANAFMPGREDLMTYLATENAVKLQE